MSVDNCTMPLQDERARMAAFCNYPPDAKEWPIEFLDALIMFEQREGNKALLERIRKIFTR